MAWYDFIQFQIMAFPNSSNFITIECQCVAKAKETNALYPTNYLITQNVDQFVV